MKLFTYWRSTAAYRVRIGLNLKGVKYEDVFINLVKDGGEHVKKPYLKLNLQGLVPSLELDDGSVLSQSVAILEFLEETYPQSPFLPAVPVERAKVRALAQIVTSDMHPINNLRVLKYLTKDMQISEQDKLVWYRHWIECGFDSIEKTLERNQDSSTYCFGETPTLADICLVPQIYNAKRFEVDLSPYPIIQRIEVACMALPAFVAAQPEKQADAT